MIKCFDENLTDLVTRGSKARAYGYLWNLGYQDLRATQVLRKTLRAHIRAEVGRRGFHGVVKFLEKFINENTGVRNERGIHLAGKVM